MPTMTSLFALWLPIVLSAVFVFVLSSLVHMVLQSHKNDYGKLAREDEVLDAMRKLGVAPGQYMFPCAGSMKEFGTPEMQAKFARGPVGTLIVRGAEGIRMGKALGQWFLLCAVVGVCTAYVAGMNLAAGAEGMRVFRLAGTVALLCHGFSGVNDSIWKGVRWSTALRFGGDGVLYGLATGAVFAWCWPAA